MRSLPQRQSLSPATIRRWRGPSASVLLAANRSQKPSRPIWKRLRKGAADIANGSYQAAKGPEAPPALLTEAQLPPSTSLSSSRVDRLGEDEKDTLPTRDGINEQGNDHAYQQERPTAERPAAERHRDIRSAPTSLTFPSPARRGPPLGFQLIIGRSRSWMASFAAVSCVNSR